MSISRNDFIIECELQKGINANWDSYGLNVNGTLMEVPKANIKSITDINENELQDISDWIDTYVIPHMTRKSINYNTGSSYHLKHIIEKQIGFYVSNETVKYLLALKGIRGECKNARFKYPLNLYYPLSSKWEKTFPIGE